MTAPIRGKVKRVSLEIEYPDGSGKTGVFEIDETKGGLLWDEGLINELLTGGNDCKETWLQGLSNWKEDGDKPVEERSSAIFLPTVVFDSRVGCGGACYPCQNCCFKC